jgi:hypothetical protein
MTIFLLRPLLCALCVLAATITVRGQEEAWSVKAELARCVIQHAEDYISGNSDDPIIIYLEACPEPSTEKSLALLLENSIVPELNVDAGADIDAIVVFTRSELACIAKIQIEYTDGIVSLPKKPRC